MEATAAAVEAPSVVEAEAAAVMEAAMEMGKEIRGEESKGGDAKAIGNKALR